jgi:hypothetical protein
MAITDDYIKLASFDGLGQQTNGVTSHAYETAFALSLEILKGMECFGKNHVQIGLELDVVSLKDIDMVGLEKAKGSLATFLDVFGGEIELVFGDAAAFGGQNHFIAPAPLETFAQYFLRFAAAVVGAGIDQVNATVDCQMKGTDRFGFFKAAVETAEGAAAKTKG